MVTSRLQNLMMPSPAALGFFREELEVARSVFLLAVDPAAGFVIASRISCWMFAGRDSNTALSISPQHFTEEEEDGGCGCGGVEEDDAEKQDGRIIPLVSAAAVLLRVSPGGCGLLFFSPALVERRADRISS